MADNPPTILTATQEHRVYIEQNGSVVSPFYGILLSADQNIGTLNMVVEAPRWTNANLHLQGGALDSIN
ncbi:hypothetical protein K466DRAFT_603542 [Polyporus arcularius HHB13444]|uniref:Uncharacterized protein n=1 Tax=Polyporus arcularius HHB13444 TaxID=1314778 RepID=A0A5C3NZD1_9APHY|nr:hypothetical protein K466DRAFT_603542 [Polyporus arcularius HHB13444]